MSAGDWKELLRASKEGDLGLVEYYIKMGIDPNYQHPEFLTAPLFESIRSGHLDIVQYLLENGADPNLKEGFGTDTPISVAKAVKNKAAIQLLKQHQMTPSTKISTERVNKILITGGNRGIGKAIAQQLLAEGQKVVIVSRNVSQGQAVVEELKASSGNPNIELIQGDLSTIAQCRTLVQRIKVEHSDINVFISNAGVWMTDLELNEDQLEKSFMVNYLAPYILCRGLFPLLKANGPSRIVNVNAGLYIKGKLDLNKTPTGLDFGPFHSYATTKLCNVLFTIDFAREIANSGVTINAVHPGVINTGLGDSPKLISRLIKFVKRFWKSPTYGAKAPCWLAISDEVEGVNGKYYNEMEVMPYIDAVKDEALQKELRLKTKEILRE